MWRLLGLKGSSFGECDLGDCGLLGLRLVPRGELCGGSLIWGPILCTIGNLFFRPLLEKLPSPGPTHRFGGSMSGGSGGEAVVRWDVEEQSRIAVVARGGGADSVWGGMFAKDASMLADADVVC